VHVHLCPSKTRNAVFVITLANVNYFQHSFTDRFTEILSLYLWHRIPHTHARTHTHAFNGLFSRTTWVSQNQKGKTSLDLYEARGDGVLEWQWHQLDHIQTIFLSFQEDSHTYTSSLNFYRPDALPDAQPTVSEHWMQEALKALLLWKLFCLSYDQNCMPCFSFRHHMLPWWSAVLRRMCCLLLTMGLHVWMLGRLLYWQPYNYGYVNHKCL